MRCLRIYATPDGESHFGRCPYPNNHRPLIPNEAPFELSSHYPASRIRFVHVPAGMGEIGWHAPPGRVLTVWLDGIMKFETSDGEVRHVSAGGSMLVEDTLGKATSHVTPKRVALDSITMPESLDSPPITTLGVAVELIG